MELLFVYSIRWHDFKKGNLKVSSVTHRFTCNHFTHTTVICLLVPNHDFNKSFTVSLVSLSVLCTTHSGITLTFLVGQRAPFVHESKIQGKDQGVLNRKPKL